MREDGERDTEKEKERERKGVRERNYFDSWWLSSFWFQFLLGFNSAYFPWVLCKTYTETLLSLS